jgi:hypothetical protein
MMRCVRSREPIQVYIIIYDAETLNTSRASDRGGVTVREQRKGEESSKTHVVENEWETRKRPKLPQIT